MTAQIALLRAINVGGIKVSMADLRALLADLGLQDAQTLLNSGNAVFRSKNKTGAAVEEFLETESAQRAGSQTDFFVRSVEEWKSIIALNPFTEEAKRDPGHLLIVVHSSRLRTKKSVCEPVRWANSVSRNFSKAAPVLFLLRKTAFPEFSKVCASWNPRSANNARKSAMPTLIPPTLIARSRAICAVIGRSRWKRWLRRFL